jgi:ribose transport system ATP-binding protein
VTSAAAASEPANREAGRVLLEACGVTKFFPGVVALDNVDFEARSAEVHALVGENGAGKSTLIKLMAGFYSPDEGEIRIGGRRLVPDPAAAHAGGVATIHQESQLIPFMSVAENIVLGRWPIRLGLVQRRQLRRRAREALDRVAPWIDLDVEARFLNPAEAQLVEIARGLAEANQVLVMDEPTSSLSPREVERLFELIRAITDEGVGVVFVSHWLEEVFRIADRITVLRDGRVIGTRDAARLDIGQVVHMMVGRSVEERPPAARKLGAQHLLSVEGLGRDGVFDDVSFTLRPGEIVSLAGLVGAGRTEIARCIFGIDPYDRGRILVDGKPLRPHSPRAAMHAGIGLVPEDRREQALIEMLAIRDNITLGLLEELTPHGFVRREREDEIARTQQDELHIKAPSLRVRVDTLSGGNQQKVVIARWLARRPRILILDEPTKGIDVGTKAEIHELIGRLAGEGVAVLMVTSELSEALLLSDRVLVMRSGSLVADLPRAELSSEAVMTYATTG